MPRYKGEYCIYSIKQMCLGFTILQFPFNYKCGVCGKVIILDKEGIIRYHAEYIDNYFIRSIAERYDVEKNPAKKNTVVVNGGK